MGVIELILLLSIFTCAYAAAVVAVITDNYNCNRSKSAVGTAVVAVYIYNIVYSVAIINYCNDKAPVDDTLLIMSLFVASVNVIVLLANGLTCITRCANNRVKSHLQRL